MKVYSTFLKTQRLEPRTRVSWLVGFCFHHIKWLNCSIWPIDGNLTDTTTLDQSGLGTNDNERALQFPKSFKSEALYSNALVLYPGHLLVGESYSSAVSSFYILSWLQCTFLHILLNVTFKISFSLNLIFFYLSFFLGAGHLIHCVIPSFLLWIIVARKGWALWEATWPCFSCVSPGFGSVHCNWPEILCRLDVFLGLSDSGKVFFTYT